MSDNRQSVVAAGLLSSLANMFFKGLDKAISDAVEYEEEMGVLKQVNKIPIKDKQGNEYVLKVKLSPVRGKDSFYFVEVDCDAPNLNLASLSKQTLRIDNTKINQFKDIISKVIEKSGYEILTPYNRDETSSDASDSDDSSDSILEDSDFAEQADAVMNEVINRVSKKGSIQIDVADDETIDISISFGDMYLELDNPKIDCDISAVASDESGIELADSLTYAVFLSNDDGSVRSADEIIDDILSNVEDYARVRNFDTSEIKNNIQSKTVLMQATVCKEEGSNDISLLAINASTDLRSAMNVLCDITEDEGFLVALTPGQAKSIEVIDDGSEYDVQWIEQLNPELDTTYEDFFKYASSLASALKSYRWYLGCQEWDSDAVLYTTITAANKLEDAAAGWLIDHKGVSPIIIINEGVPELDCFRTGEDNTFNKELLKDTVVTTIKNELNDIFEVYYVNLTEEEQLVADSIFKELQNCVMYS